MNLGKILLSASMIAFVGAAAFTGTGAFFSDTETSTGNTFTAGEIDLTVDSVAHYNGLVCFGDEWVPEDAVVWNPDTEQLDAVGNTEEAIDEFNTENPNNFPQAGDECNGTWALTDLGPTHQFFNYGDLKPGDSGENTLSLHLDTNDGYVCAVISNLEDNDNGLTEPEEEDGDSTGGDGEGELSQELRFFAWADDGDNIWEEGEDELFSNTEGPASDVIGGVSYPLFTPQTQAMSAGSTTYIGLYWCYGDITVGANTLSCDGASSTNITQTDSMTADISFYVEQSRNNEEFTCPDPEEFEGDDERPLVGAADNYAAPALESCSVVVGDTESIQAAVDGSSEGALVCVDDTYDATGDNTAIRLSVDNLTLAALTQGTVIDVPVVLDNDGTTVTGFTGTVGQAESPAEVAAFYIDGDADNVEISYNSVNGGANGVLTETSATLTGALIRHNVFQNLTRGIFFNPSQNMVAEFNDFLTNTVGVANDEPHNNIIRYNVFSGNTESVGYLDEANGGIANNGVLNVNFNNIYDGAVNNYSVATSLNAENNWWGGNGATDQDNQSGPNTAPVDSTPEEAVAFPEN